MKKMRMIIALMLAICLLCALPVCVQAEEELSLTRVVQVSHTQVVMEFSRPIAVSLNESVEPWVSIRAVKPGQGNPQRADDGATYLQWQVGLMYLDAKHDRLLGTLSGSAFGMESISDILGWKGALAPYADRGWEMQLVLEEKNDSGDGGNDGKVCNITTPDGATMLTGVKGGGYESARMPITVDFGYALDLTKVEPIRIAKQEEQKEEKLPYQEDWLTVKRAVQVSKNQIVVEFSEPIAVALTQARGPFIALRLVNKGGNAAIKTDDGKEYLQWQFGAQFLDKEHDRLLCTMSTVAAGVDTIDGIRNFSGALTKYANRNWELRLVIEEYPDDRVNYSDCGVCNITTPDGAKMLFPTHVNGFEAVSVLLERDLSYAFDPKLAESTKVVVGLDADTVVMMDGAEYTAMQDEKEPTVQTVVNTVEVLANDPLVIALVLGGSVLVGGLAVVIAVLATKKRKAGK